MPDTHEMVAGDLLPELVVTLLQPDGKTPIEGLTAGTTIHFVMKTFHDDAVPLIDYKDAVVVDGPLAKVKYAWGAGETASLGRKVGRFRTTVSGKEMHFPNKRWITLNFNES